jgi:RNA polymerase sigma factor (TIGR02999 family)
VGVVLSDALQALNTAISIKPSGSCLAILMNPSLSRVPVSQVYAVGASLRGVFLPVVNAGTGQKGCHVVTQDVTQLLCAWSEGDEAALEQLVPLVELELHRLARAYMSRERRGHTLQATALVNEVFLRLAQPATLRWRDRAHFIGIAARLMRRVLVDHARSHGSQKRGGGASQVPLDEAQLVTPELSVDVIAVDRALEAFAKIDPRKSQIVELRFFGGLTVDETAEVVGISVETVKRDWRVAKLWLSRELQGQPHRSTS